MKPDDQILITGAAGLIGSALVWELNRRGHENLILCDVLGSDEKWRNLVPLRYDDYLDASQLLERLDSELLRLAGYFEDPEFTPIPLRGRYFLRLIQHDNGLVFAAVQAL